MLHLTPIEETALGRELKHLWTTEGRREGMGKGQLIGEIRLAQRLLNRRVRPPQTLARKSVKELKTIFQEFDAGSFRP